MFVKDVDIIDETRCRLIQYIPTAFDIPEPRNIAVSVSMHFPGDYEVPYNPSMLFSTLDTYIVFRVSNSQPCLSAISIHNSVDMVQQGVYQCLLIEARGARSMDMFLHWVTEQLNTWLIL